MKRKWSLTALVVSMSLFAAACGGGSDSTGGSAASSSPSASAASSPSAAPQELTIKHQLGEAKVKVNPQKVLVFDYGALDTLDKLGVNVTGVAQKNVPPYLSKYKDAKYENIGTLQEPDYEKISALKPDLILISGRQQTAYPELNKIAPTVYVGVDNKNYMESFKTNMRTIGQIFGKTAEVEAELTNIDKAVEEVKAKAAASGKNGLIVLANEGAISAFGPGSRFGLIHDVLGVPAAEKNLDSSTPHGQSVSFEFIAEKNPDYLFVIDRGAAVGGTQGANAKALIENELVKKTKAYANNNIVYLDQNYWYLSGGGLLSVAEMIGEINKALE
ncbi:siderophore ABC transporter substrate-binding protein [Paenibacillus thermoaerophilus]|uniref:Siderophore ABC transporter substrate-binding protein n=1 Tax=Paenibacillus thermoaerophilus TaxID=1215385 RepID=A0ABW2V3J0_9BACL|nr:siderophore ABC transporter substrate-binding protein [Paenibacillus thermoaerophilus]TMV14317.1 siderophore ABC transporter substrate-binding protein [Paenibacillus thermoaerophilus]